VANNRRSESWASIITAVTSFHGVCALVMLVAGAAFGAFVARKVNEAAFYSLLYFLIAVVVLNLYYSVYLRRIEHTFRVKVSRSADGVLLPWEGLKVKLVKNGKVEHTKTTNEVGEVSFRQNVGKGDELEVQLIQGAGPIKTAVLYSEGEFQTIKSIILSQASGQVEE
jgi:hypothetical protein